MYALETSEVNNSVFYEKLMFFLLNSASNRILLVCMRTEIIGNVFQFSEFNVYLIGKLHPISGLLSGNFFATYHLK